MSKKVVKVQFTMPSTQIGRGAIPESHVEPGKRNYDNVKTNMSYDPKLGLTITFEGTRFTQFIPNANICGLLIEDVVDVPSPKDS